MILPPKRYESTEDVRYDPIRFRPWFGRLIRRRAKIPLLEQAYASIKRGNLQKDAAIAFGVDTRELRDYVAFHVWDGVKSNGMPQGTAFQAVLDEAYSAYDRNHGKQTFRYYIYKIAPRYGLDARPVFEAWETNPTFYPTGYSK